MGSCGSYRGSLLIFQGGKDRMKTDKLKKILLFLSWIPFVLACSDPFPEGNGFDRMILIRLIPLPTSSVAVTSDTDTDYDTFAGTVTITPPEDDDWIHSYGVYFGTSANNPGSLFTTVNATGGVLTVDIPAGTTFPHGSSYIVVVSQNALGNQSYVHGSAAFTDLRQYRIFVSNSTTNGNIAALGTGNWMENADALCDADFNKPVAPTNAANASYAAMLVDGNLRVACTSANCSTGTSGQKNWVLKDNTEYLLSPGSLPLFITDSHAIFNFSGGNMTNPFDTGGSAWFTGLLGDWTPVTLPIDGNCSQWGSTTGNGQYGNINQVDSNAIYTSLGGIICSSSNRILCVQQ